MSSTHTTRVGLVKTSLYIKYSGALKAGSADRTMSVVEILLVSGVISAFILSMSAQVTLSLSRGEMISLDASPVPAYPVEFSQSIGAVMTYALIVE
jgi:hypothetical protein